MYVRVVSGLVDNYLGAIFGPFFLFSKHGEGVFQTYLGVSKRKQKNESAVKLVFIV